MSEQLWSELQVHHDVVLIPLRSNTSEARKVCEARNLQHHATISSRYAFLHVNLTEDPSQFASPIRIQVRRDDEDFVIEVSDAVAVANAIAFVGLRLNVREVVIGLLDSGTPLVNALLYLLFGTGEVGYAVRAIFVRIREQTLAQQFEQRQSFDTERDKMEKELLRDMILLDPEVRKAKMEEMFAREQANFERNVQASPQLPRLILFD